MKIFRSLATWALALALGWLSFSAEVMAQPRVPNAEEQREADQLTAEQQKQFQAHDYPSAVATAQKLWSLKQKIYGAEADEAQSFKRNFAETLDVAGRYGEALELLQQLIATAEKQHGAVSRQVSYALARTEGLLGSMQRWDDLDAVHQRVLAIDKQLEGEASLSYTIDLGSYASFLASRSQFSAARLAFERQLKLSEQRNGGKLEAFMVSSLMALGRIYWDLQQTAKATAALDRALAMSEQTPGMTPGMRAPMIVGVAMIYRLGERIDLAAPLEKRARDLYKQEIARLEKTNPGSVELTTVLGSSGQLQDWTGDPAGAEQLLARAIEIDQQRGRESYWVASLAVIKRTLGKPKEGLALLDRASAAAEKSSAMKNVYASMRADMYADLGDYTHAQAELTEYVAQMARLRGKDSAECGGGYMRLGVNEVRRGNLADAESRLIEGLELAERELNIVLKSGTESDHRAWFRRNTYQLDMAVSFQQLQAKNSAGAARLALTTLLRRKGRLLDVTAANLATIRAKLSAADRQLLDDLAAARGQLAKRKVAGPGDDPDAFAKDVATVEGRIQELEVKLSQKSTAYRAGSQPIELAAVQKLIPAGTLLIELVNYQPLDFKPSYVTKPPPLPRRYVAYVVGPSGDPTAIDLGLADAIDQAVTVYRKALSNPKSDRVKELGRALYDLTFAKITPKLGAATELLLAPDGTLNLVPFAALVDEQQGFLISRFTFSYLTSGRDLLRLKVKAKAQSGSVILADPTFDSGAPAEESTSRGSRSVDLSTISWPQLPGTRQEAEQVVKTMKKFKLYAGEQATESQLKKLHGPRILHLATHGFFLRDKPRTPSRGFDAPAGPIAPPPAEENPLLRSGLALAGANELTSGSEDGILTALEATGLDLWGTKLVVLSACQTGDGKVTNGDGVYGLRRAFVIAGAKGLVMTLWQVDDLATRDLMVGFYRQLQKGRARSTALRNMQLELLAQPKYAHPYFWASFVPAGENAPIKD